MMFLSIIALAGNFFLTTALKGQYFIDNFGGLLLGHYLWVMAHHKLSYWVDVRLFGMTVYERYPNIPTKCDKPFYKCNQKINQWAVEVEED